ncbi:MAG TPA: flagellar motor switch protein FliN [Bryobacteraceae bacterium]|nr:flagellar motor switch protein FliN [Bryobacteraceae bacterium]
MPVSRATDLAWLVGEFSSHLVSVFETMAGERPSISQTPASQTPATHPGEGLLWRQAFAGIAGALWILAPEAAWTFAAGQILRAAGMEDAGKEDTGKDTLESTYLEIIAQAVGAVAQAISARLSREVTPAGGEKNAVHAGDTGWIALEIAFGSGAATIFVDPEASLVDGLAPATGDAPAEDVEAGPEESSSASKTFDLLLDVEMPVSVSFGRAQVPLKDVLKLTTGSIVELNRSIVEPVEVIVNNCVIARGEVVVAEGNFGVRIQQVVSRRERLRTLN